MNKPVPPFLGSVQEAVNPDIVIAGIPYDGTSTGRKGADRAPREIRAASDLIETFSPFLDASLDDITIFDRGDLILPKASPFTRIIEAADELFTGGGRLMFFGGEHSITPFLVQAAVKTYPGLKVLIFDAHTDLREEYQGSPDNHACASRRTAEAVGWENLRLVGVRSGTREEFAEVHERGLLMNAAHPQIKALADDWLKGSPVYISLDLDVFDPSLIPGTGAPEPGGITYREFLECVTALRGIDLIGFDMVELCPPADPAGVSAVTAASAARELMLLTAGKQRF